MRIVILCRDANLHGIRRIRETAEAREHSVRVLDPYRFLLKVRGKKIATEFEGKPLEAADVFLPRLGAGISEHSLALCRHLEAAGRLVVNPPGALEIARDKLRALQLFSRSGLPVPRSAFAPDPDYLARALKAVGGAPVILKLPRAAQGRGVMLARDAAEAQAIADTMWNLERDILIQEYVEEARGRDLRVLVIGGQAIAAVRRSARRGAFRSNLHRGGKARKARLTPEAAALAVRAAEVCGLEIAGIDLLPSRRGLLVLEANAAPGFEGIEAASGMDVAERIVAHLEWRVLKTKLRRLPGFAASAGGPL